MGPTTRLWRRRAVQRRRARLLARPRRGEQPDLRGLRGGGRAPAGGDRGRRPAAAGPTSDAWCCSTAPARWRSGRARWSWWRRRPHRAEAFEAARFCIDTLKHTVPIWKLETWDGGEDWSQGCLPVQGCLPSARSTPAERGRAGTHEPPRLPRHRPRPELRRRARAVDAEPSAEVGRRPHPGLLQGAGGARPRLAGHARQGPARRRPTATPTTGRRRSPRSPSSRRRRCIPRSRCSP